MLGQHSQEEQGRRLGDTRVEPYPFRLIPHLQAEAGRVKRTGSHMHREKQRRKTQRERQERRERERKKRLVTAALSKMSLVQGCAGPKRGPDFLYKGHYPSWGHPTTHTLCHPYPILCHSLETLSQEWPSDRGFAAPSTWLYHLPEDVPWRCSG